MHSQGNIAMRAELSELLDLTCVSWIMQSISLLLPMALMLHWIFCDFFWLASNISCKHELILVQCT
jgi:hypothetical protein